MHKDSLFQLVIILMPFDYVYVFKSALTLRTSLAANFLGPKIQ